MTLTVVKILLCHLQRLIDVGGQDGQEVIYTTDKESPWKTRRQRLCLDLFLSTSFSVYCMSVITRPSSAVSVARPVSPEEGYL